MKLISVIGADGKELLVNPNIVVKITQDRYSEYSWITFTDNHSVKIEADLHTLEVLFNDQS